MTEQQIEERGRKRKTSGSYASKYYDPDKAHEYYMAHRQLKGRKSPGSKKKSTSKNSEEEKQILPKAKDNTENNIAQLRDTVADWIDKMEEKIDNATSSEEKKKLRKQIKAVRRAMNAQIRKARAIYRQFKKAYKNHTLDKLAAQQKEEKKDDK